MNSTLATHNFPSRKTITVEVTAEDIDLGKRRDNWSCPICRALWRATGEKWVVEESTCYPITRRNAFIPLPPEAVAWLRKFDSTGFGWPFSFQLEMPQ